MITAADLDEARELLRLDRAELARRSLAHFFRQSWPITHASTPLEWGPHLDAVCSHLQIQLEESAAAREWIKAHPGHVGDLPEGVRMRAQDLCLNLPPRSLKTSAAVAADAWSWVRWPELEIFFLSGNPQVPLQAAREFRDLITSDWYRRSFGITWSIRGDQDALGSIGNTAGGSRHCRGTRADITGQGGDVLRIDDPSDLKDSRDAIAQTVEHFKVAIANRVNDPRTAIRCLIMQRLVIGDLTGAYPWHRVVLPMEWEPDVVGGEGKGETAYGIRDFRDPRPDGDLNAAIGGVLHPRFTPEFIAGERARLGASYVGQMQQRPVSAEGGTFKRAWFRFFRFADATVEGAGPRPAGCIPREDAPARVIRLSDLQWISITVDPTFGDTKNADNVGLLVVGGLKADRFVLEDATRKMNITDTIAAIFDLRRRWPHANEVVVERKANGDAIINLLASELGGFVGVNPAGGKERRADACVPQVSGGNVYLLDGAPWLDAFVTELCGFPDGALHDDRVDALTQLLIHKGTNPQAARTLALMSAR